jgi:hypothetical protein
MHIEVIQTRGLRGSPFTCLVCAESYSLSGLAFRVDGGEPEKFHDTSLGYICGECIELEPEARCEKLQAHAARLLDWSRMLKDIAAADLPWRSARDAERYADWHAQRQALAGDPF